MNGIDPTLNDSSMILRESMEIAHEEETESMDISTSKAITTTVSMITINSITSNNTIDRCSPTAMTIDLSPSSLSCMTIDLSTSENVSTMSSSSFLPSK